MNEKSADLLSAKGCGMHFKGSYYKVVSQIRKTAGKAINQYGLIVKDDRVLVGLSGGKDSLVLLDTLVERQHYIPISYTVEAVHVVVDNLPEFTDTSYLKEFCRERGVPLNIQHITVDIDFEKEKSPCFYCSWFRRKKFFDIMKESSFNKLALGHHLDDIIETLLLNMTMNSRISSIPLKLSMFNGEFDIIRPLGLLLEKQIDNYCKLKNFSPNRVECSYGVKGKRGEIKKILDQMEKTYPKVKKNLYASMKNIDKDYLP